MDKLYAVGTVKSVALDIYGKDTDQKFCVKLAVEIPTKQELRRKIRDACCEYITKIGLSFGSKERFRRKVSLSPARLIGESDCQRDNAHEAAVFASQLEHWSSCIDGDDLIIGHTTLRSFCCCFCWALLASLLA